MDLNSKEWGLYEHKTAGFTDIISIIPENDNKEHILGRECHCKPSIENVDGVELIKHNSFDKRELLEQLELGVKN